MFFFFDNNSLISVLILGQGRSFPKMLKQTFWVSMPIKKLLNSIFILLSPKLSKSLLNNVLHWNMSRLCRAKRKQKQIQIKVDVCFIVPNVNQLYGISFLFKYQNVEKGHFHNLVLVLVFRRLDNLIYFLILKF